ncbi:alpha/beta hydrolase-fold protein [Cytophagaceae bacterium YF14B1]|uniref:Alpha/beta hydrolase-fold protein n=1 Tax=Xanthocytophaga flava TaxID=3048013 RepID=A0AAE3QUM9_9BACT|nr:alpha/beta hydrolase-fold protein [Xanthocytophaga flavus]MDJ1485722.1 alpha/beta hydrolase-fold protein [Xanthocytophaga flavus]
MNREYHQWFSPHLNRTMELLVLGTSGTRVLVFPARMGRFYDYEDWGLSEVLKPHLCNGELQLFCVDSIDGESLYNFWADPPHRIRRHLAYEQYVLKEVLPFSEKKNPNSSLISHGCSLGAFHAVNIAFRHPQLFDKVIAFSGRYDLSVPVAEFSSLFGDYYDEEIYFNTPSHFLYNLQDEYWLEHLRQMEIVLTCGNEDPFLENNRAFSQLLWQKRICHSYYEWQGRAHKPHYWRQMIGVYLQALLC